MNADLIFGPAVVLLGPGHEVVNPEALASRRLTVVQMRPTRKIGPCAMSGCSGIIMKLSVPVRNPNTGERSLHHAYSCSDPGCSCACAKMDPAEARVLLDRIGYPWN